MKRFLVLMVGSVLAAGTVGACLVDRKTNDFSCATQADCAPDRTCTGGFCVEGTVTPDAPGCPAPCDTCNLALQTCTVDCDTAQGCGTIACPEGFTCTINCTAANACGNVDCSAAKACTIDCDGANACNDVTCGPGACEVTCNGNEACNTVDCAASCQCDVDCDRGSDCQQATCPEPTSGAGNCTDGTPAGCDSTRNNCERTCP